MTQRIVIEVPDQYYGFWPDERREKICATLRAIIAKYDISTDSGADAACEQLWNAMVLPPSHSETP